jgi:hypothetical protein
MKYPFLVLLLSLTTVSFAQVKLNGFVTDSSSRTPLSFATVQTADGKQSVISGLNGKFTIQVPEDDKYINVSFIGYVTKKVRIGEFKNGDTVELNSNSSEMNEVVIYSNDDKIRRIINSAVRNKPSHNPELYDRYQCNVYYKMHLDLNGFDMQKDSVNKNRDSSVKKPLSRKDSIYNSPPDFSQTHMLFSETYSKRLYQKPQQVQEIILASRFSGIHKTYFTNLVTNVLPFHIYTDFINLNGIDYINPIAKGWQQRYKFHLREQMLIGKDTVFLMEFEPKGGSFDALRGIVYINSNGYAISHFIGTTADSSADRIGKIEQIYSFVNGKWFPEELNYDFVIRRIYQKHGELKMNGHSVIDSVSFEKQTAIKFDKAHSTKLSDSADLHTEQQWEHFRPAPITKKEANTYKVIDSISKELKLEKLIVGGSHLAIGRLPVGKVDLDVTRLLASNKFEGTRIGAGVFTNNKISRYYSIGGWAGYGTKDKQWKYGSSLSFYPHADKENSLTFSYSNTYRTAGEALIHPDLTKTGLSNWLLGKVDKIEAYKISASLRKGYWEISPEVLKMNLKPQYPDSFLLHGTQSNFTNEEGSLGIRYAYGEKRIPVFDYYMPSATKYPVVYLRIAYGNISSSDYSNRYTRMLTAVTYTYHVNRWGIDHLRAEAGLLNSFNNQAFPLSLLMAGNGIRISNFSVYSQFGFVTMHPYDFFTDHYVSLLYRHDFDNYFWDKKLSKPFLTVAHNMIYGSLTAGSKAANPGINSLTKGYHESGLLVNQLIRKNLHFADLNIGVGAFHHWTPGKYQKESTVGVFSVYLGF